MSHGNISCHLAHYNTSLVTDYIQPKCRKDLLYIVHTTFVDKFVIM